MNIDFSQMIPARHKLALALEEARARAQSALLSEIEAFAEQVTGRVPLTEKLSWGTKEIAARAVDADEATASQEAMIAGEAALTGETVKALAGRVIRNADSYRAMIAMLTGLRRHTEAALAAAQTEVEVEQSMTEARGRLMALVGS